jgi:Fibronectin type III domain
VDDAREDTLRGRSQRANRLRSTRTASRWFTYAAGRTAAWKGSIHGFAAAALGCVALLITGCGGGGGGGSSSPTTPGSPPPAPTSVVVTAGNHSLHITWNVVTGATSYKVYISPTAFTDTGGLTGTSVTSSPYDATGLDNWVTYHVRVTAEADAGSGALSAEATAVPSAGYVVASEVDAANMDAPLAVKWFRADETDVVTDTIAGGFLFHFALVGTTAQLYGVTTGAAGLYSEVGVASAAGHTAFASAAGHTYAYLGIAANRAIFQDAHGGAYDVMSYALDGSDAKMLIAGCTAPIVGTGPVLNDNGALFECDTAVIRHVWSDGVNAAVTLGESNTFVNRIAYILEPTRAYFLDTNTGRIYVEKLDGTQLATEGTDLVGTLTASGGSVTIIAAGASAMLVKTIDTAFKASLYLYDLAGNLIANEVLNAQNADFNVFDASGTSDDGHSFLVVASGTTPTVFVVPDSGPPNVDVSVGATVDYARFIPGGRVLERVPGAPWQTVSLATPTTATTLTGSSNTDILRGVQQNWILQSSGTNLLSYASAGGTTHTLSTNYNAQHLAFEPDLTVFWVENDYTAHVAAADLSISPTQIDTGAFALTEAGTAADGRHYLLTQRFPTLTDYDTTMWTPTATSAQIIAGSTSSEIGRFFP